MNHIVQQESIEGRSAHARLAQLEDDVQKLLGKLRQMGAANGLEIDLERHEGRPSGHSPAAPPISSGPRFDRAPTSDGGSAHRVTEDRSRARFVRKLIRRRRRREQFFPAELFADPAWDMLLDLYAAHYERRTVSVSSLSIAAAVPATTALRWIKTMTDMGAFTRIADPADGRRIHVHLSDDMRQRLDQYFENFDD